MQFLVLLAKKLQRLIFQIRCDGFLLHAYLPGVFLTDLLKITAFLCFHWHCVNRYQYQLTHNLEWA